MSKKCRLLVIFLFAVIFSVECNAVDLGDLSKDIDTTPLYDSIPEYAEDLLEDKVDLESAESFEIDSFVDLLINIVKKAMPDFFNELTSLIVLMLAVSLINISKKHISSTFFSDIIDFASTVIPIGVGYSLIKNTVNTVNIFIEGVNHFINSLIPVSTLLFSMGGNVSTAVVNSSGLTVLVTITNAIIQNAVLPILEICLGLSIGGCLSKQDGILKITSSVKKLFTTVLTATMTVFSIFLIYKTNLSASADSFAARTIRFAGSFVPVVGSVLGESVRSVMGGVSMIKNSVGFIGIIITVTITLPVVLFLFGKILCMNISMGLGSLVGCDEQTKIFEEFSSYLGFLLAVVICISVLLVIELSVIVMISPALGGA